MNPRLAVLPAVALLTAVVLAGCGSSSSTTSQSTPAATAPAATTPAGAATSTAPSGGTSTAAAEAGAAAAAACQQAVKAQPTLAAATKARLEAICAKAATGGAAEIKKVEDEICEEVVNTVPAAEREQAKAACKSVAAG